MEGDEKKIMQLVMPRAKWYEVVAELTKYICWRKSQEMYKNNCLKCKMFNYN